MKITIITPFFPGKTTGGKKIFLDLIKVLSENNDILLISRIEPWENEAIRDVEKYCKIVYLYEFNTPQNRNLLNIFLIVFSYLFFAVKARRVVKDLDTDIIQVSYADLGLFLHKSTSIIVPMVLDTHDVNSLISKRKFMETKGWDRLKAWITMFVVRHAEKYTLKRFDLITTRSDSDKCLFEQMGVNTPVVAVRQPVDISGKPTLDADEREAYSLLFVGAMHRELNVEYVLYFYDKILPKIRKKIGEVKLYVVGNNPPQKLLDLSHRDKNVIVTGFVDDIESFFRMAMVFVSPILVGGGVIVKNLEAMASGLPVVTTTIGNEGIGAHHGREIMIADNPENFTEYTVRLLQDEKLHQRISESAVGFIKNNFSSERVTKTIETAYLGLLSQ